MALQSEAEDKDVQPAAKVPRTGELFLLEDSLRRTLIATTDGPKTRAADGKSKTQQRGVTGKSKTEGDVETTDVDRMDVDEDVEMDVEDCEYCGRAYRDRTKLIPRGAFKLPTCTHCGRCLAALPSTAKTVPTHRTRRERTCRCRLQKAKVSTGLYCL